MKLEKLKIIAGNHIVVIFFTRIVREYGALDLFINDEYISLLTDDIVYNIDKRSYYLASQNKDWLEMHERDRSIENV